MSSVIMDDRGSQSHLRSSGLRLSTKNKAPSPPGLKKLDSSGFTQWHPGNPHLTMDQKENLIDKELSLSVVLPGGVEKRTLVHGSTPLMDLLVTLCAQYHLNPSGHTLELVTSNRNNIKLKPNALLGTLDAEKIILKPKGEDSNKKTGPQMPEATVRMVINYKKTQKTILRVNPRVPLREHLPAICEKCEFDVETTVLLRDVTSLAPLDLSNCLNDYEIREVYAKDTKRQADSPVFRNSSACSGEVTPGKDKHQKEKENKGMFSMFRRSKKKSVSQPTTASAPASPVLVSKPRPLSMALPSSNSSPLGSPTILDMPKKRRAPQPPILASQSCHSDVAIRRRLNSEPIPQFDSDQVAGVNRWSTGESSLRRTKRKAPPPPTSLSSVLKETISNDGLSEVTANANTLQEITEQEETGGSVISAAACSNREEFSSLSMSSEVSLLSPSPDIESRSTVQENGEDQCPDLSSHDNLLESIVNDSAAPSGQKSDGADSLVVRDGGPTEDLSSQSINEEFAADQAEGDSKAPPVPQMKDAEVQASSENNTETLQEQSDGATAGEDVQVQTDFTRIPAPPPQEQEEKVPSSATSQCVQTVEKGDTATLTEEMQPPDLKHAPLHPASCTPGVPAATKAPSLYATNAEPKPKPSNELTRDYIPKVGMTTYTIVPQKSLEKLRYFEVALTLEAPAQAPVEGRNVGSLSLDENTTQKGQNEVSQDTSELQSVLPREDLLTRTVTATTTTHTTSTTTQHTVNGPEPTYPSSLTLRSPDENLSSTNLASPPASPAEVKEMKIPPATKPKPASFRLAQHKKTPGYYVTSAAEKRLSLKETPERAMLPPPPPPPPSPPLPPPPAPPAVWEGETAEATNVPLSPQRDDKNVSFARMTRQSSLPAREPNVGLSLEKLRSFAAPRPFTPSTPSRFAQAVSSAVKRSQSLSHRPKSPPNSAFPPVSPVTKHPAVLKSQGLSEQENEDGVQAGP
uniref:Cordon-bleu ubiquitin-like domain-containing protein n=1 Tax=Nothobranchius furzeri TaxID=105023 RepID=A0A1A8V4H2_NOTFU